MTVIIPLESMASMYRPSSEKLRGRRPAGMPRGTSIALASAIALMYREMDMRFWLEQAEAEMRGLA